VRPIPEPSLQQQHKNNSEVNIERCQSIPFPDNPLPRPSPPQDEPVSNIYIPPLNSLFCILFLTVLFSCLNSFHCSVCCRFFLSLLQQQNLSMMQI